MYQRVVVGALLAASLGMAGLTAPAVRADDKDQAHEQMLKCAKACLDCQKECECGFYHCGRLVAEGKKEHAKMMMLCADCAELCSTAGKLAARSSPFAPLACEACAKSCEACAECCEKFTDEGHMKGAKACRDCARECREMIKHLGHGK